MTMTVSEAGRRGGSVRSEKKAAAARANAQLAALSGRGGRPVKPLAELKCTCGGGDSLTHKGTCPRYRAIRRRKLKGLPLE